MPSKQRQTADTLITAFNALDVDTIIALRTPDCVRHFLPASLNLKPQSNATYETELKSLKQIFTSFQISVHDVTEDLEQKKIVMFVSALGDTVVGEYRNEYVWRMKFDEAGEKIAEWQEFVDAGMLRDFFPKLKAELVRKAELAKKEKESGSGEVKE